MSYSQPWGEPLLWSPTASPWPHWGDAHWIGGWMEVGNWESFWAQKTAQQCEIQRVMSSVLWGQFFLMSWPKIRRRGGCPWGCVGRLRPWWRDGSCRGDQKHPVWRSRWSPLSQCMAHLCYCMSWSALISDSMYLTFFFSFRIKVLEALCKNLEGKKAVWIQILLYNDVLSTEL